MTDVLTVRDQVLDALEDVLRGVPNVATVDRNREQVDEGEFNALIIREPSQVPDHGEDQAATRVSMEPQIIGYVRVPKGTPTDQMGRAIGRAVNRLYADVVKAIEAWRRESDLIEDAVEGPLDVDMLNAAATGLATFGLKVAIDFWTVTGDPDTAA